MKRYTLVITAALLALALFAGCSSGKQAQDNYSSNTVTSPQEAPAPYPAMPSESDYNGYALTGEAAGAEGGSALPDAGDVYGGRKIIRNYDLSIQTDNFDADLASIEQRLAEFGGYAQSTYLEGKKPETYGESGRTASMTLRVPSDKADEFIKGVEAIGTLTSSHDYADDITDVYYDTDARLNILNIQLERLESILVQTDNLADVIELENRISEVMLEIEQLTGTLKKYDALIYYTTVSISLHEKSLIAGPASPATTGERISDGFTASLYGVGTFFTDLFVWLVSALPVLLVIAVIAAAVTVIVKLSIKRSRNRKAKNAARAAVEQQAIFEKQKAVYLEEQKKAGVYIPENGKDGNNEK